MIYTQRNGIHLLLPDRKDDRICLFGFSRGAYTARALAGMIHKVWILEQHGSEFGLELVLTRHQIGLLPTGNSQQVPFAYHLYTKDDEEGWKQSRKFKEAFSIDVVVEFLGVW